MRARRLAGMSRIGGARGEAAVGNSPATGPLTGRQGFRTGAGRGA